VLDAADIARLRAACVTHVTIARPGPQDVAEDAAAGRLALSLVPDEAAAGLTRSVAFTGRVNLNAVAPGIVALDAAAIHALNRIDPAITLATLAPYARVTPGMLVGTVKIIAYAVEEAALCRAERIARAAIRILPVVHHSASLLLTEVPGQDGKLAAKARRAMETRLKALGMTLDACVTTTPHDAGAMAAALVALPGDMLLILTGSATSDLYDTGPQALRMAGGSVARFGMPVDPGNLLFHGLLGNRPVIGLPGCARSPALNGADWVLERLACGLQVTDDDIAAMGVGGLLKEIPTRPQPREG
jgi:molybdenum cofactor cytidylyltransferase